MKLICILSIALITLTAIAVSDQQAASTINGDSELLQIPQYIQERDRSVAEWVEQYRLAEQEADAKKNEAEREADAKKNEALAGLVAALNRSAAAGEASARASERIARASEKGN